MAKLSAFYQCSVMKEAIVSGNDFSLIVSFLAVFLMSISHCGCLILGLNAGKRFFQMDQGSNSKDGQRLAEGPSEAV